MQDSTITVSYTCCVQLGEIDHDNNHMINTYCLSSCAWDALKFNRFRRWCHGSHYKLVLVPDTQLGSKKTFQNFPSFLNGNES